MLAAPPEPGELQSALTALCAKVWRHLCDHAAGNLRIMTTLAAELLAAGAQRELPVLDEKLYLEIFAQPGPTTARRAAPKR